ncbi:hypothetical protein B5M09_000477 [Aphanomyces astaci]|uniref:Thioredoxin domain-containing protein n=1 Tax=Aphanomyces astaci TaxID=112090 RepID=A0A3R7WF97_APHAT|nr:hypothetical protein B5M09_000477 [Aphanomyces astaci]
MDVEFDSFDDDSSIATLRIKASSQYCRNDEVFLESLMTAVKIEMGLPPAADVHLHVEDKKVHATLNKRNSSRKEEVPNVDLVDVYTQKVIPLQGALMNKPFAILVVHTTHDDCHLKQYPNVEVVHMPTQRTMHLFDFLTAGTLTVIDFWSTTCVRCPAAIAKLLTHYKKTQSSISATTIQYVLINTDNAVMGWDLVQGHEWVPFGSIVHLHVTVAVKESLKAFMAMKQMPHHVLLDVVHLSIAPNDVVG